MVANEGDVADEENAIFDKGVVLDMEDTMVDEEDDDKVEGMVVNIELLADVADEDTMVDEGVGLMPHANVSLTNLILCQLPLWSVQS